MRRAITLRGWSGERNRIPDVPATVKHRSSKDTKRWCRGKPGVEHEPAWILGNHQLRPLQPEYRRGCRVCGKHLWDLRADTVGNDRKTASPVGWSHGSNHCRGWVWETMPGSCKCSGGAHHYGCGTRTHEVFRCICGNHQEGA